MPNHDGNRMKADFLAPTWPGFVRAEDAHRHNRRQRFCNHQAETRLGRLQITVEGARSFRKNERRLFGPQNSNQCFKGAAIAAFLIDWNDIQLWQKPAPKPVLEQCFAGEKKNRAIGSVAPQRRIEKTLMIHRQNYRPALDHTFAMPDAKSKKDLGKETGESVAQPIVRVHPLPAR